MSLKTLDLCVFSRLGNARINWRIESTIFYLLILIISSCLCNSRLLFFQLSLKLFRELLLIFGRVYWVYFYVCIYSRFKSAVFKQQSLILFFKYRFSSECILCFLQNRLLARYNWTNLINLRLECPLLVLFLLFHLYNLLSPRLVLCC